MLSASLSLSLPTFELDFSERGRSQSVELVALAREEVVITCIILPVCVAPIKKKTVCVVVVALVGMKSCEY